MSNPAVVSLVSTKLKLGTMKVEANLGEPYHIHLGELRIDLEKSELCAVIEQSERLLDLCAPHELRQLFYLDGCMAKWFLENRIKHVSDLSQETNRRTRVFVLEHDRIFNRFKKFRIKRRRVSSINQYLNPIFNDISPVYFKKYGVKRLPETKIIICSEYGLCLNSAIGKVSPDYQTVSVKLGVKMHLKLLRECSLSIMKHFVKSLLLRKKIRAL